MVRVSRKSDKETAESLLRRFNRKVQQSGVLATAKKNQYFEKPVSKRERRRRSLIRKDRKPFQGSKPSR